MMRCLPTLCCATLAIGAALGAQQQGERVVPDQRPPVTFRVETNFVEIDAIVTDRDGRFVAGLTKNDFELFEEGEPQPISAFSLVQIPVRPARSPAATGIEVEPDAVSNRVPFTGRIFLLVLDDLQTDPINAEFVRKTARNFIERHVSPGDLTGIFFTSSRTNAYPRAALAGESGRRASSGTFGHRVTIPAATLGPGRFLLRLHAEPSTGGDPVVREVTFEVR